MTSDDKDFTKGEVEILIRLARMEDEIRQLKELSSKYVSRQEFESKIAPLERLSYGAVGVILLAFAAGVVSLVLIK